MAPVDNAPTGTHIITLQGLGQCRNSVPDAIQRQYQHAALKANWPKPWELFAQNLRFC